MGSAAHEGRYVGEKRETLDSISQLLAQMDFSFHNVKRHKGKF